MIRFGYKAYDAGGRFVEGEIVAECREAALEALHQRGEVPVEVVDGSLPRAQPWWQREVFATNRISRRDLALFMRELTTLIKAEIPLDEVLRIVVLQPMLSARMRLIIGAVLERVLEGQSLSQSLAAEDEAFPEYIWRLVQAGETSGKLGDVLDNVTVYLERSAEVRANVMTASLYPMILIIAAGIAVGVIMTVLLPAIVPLLKDAGADLPLIVRVLDGLRDLVIGHWSVVLVAAVAVIFLALAMRSNQSVRRVASSLALRIPIVNGLITGRETARFSRTLATLMRSGVPMLEAIRISGSVIKNFAFRSAIDNVGEQVRQGATLSQPLIDSGLFPELAVRLIAVGEQTGQLEIMLIRVADIFETTLQRRLERLTGLMTPILTLVIGLLVGWLIVSVMGALLSINQLPFS